MPDESSARRFWTLPGRFFLRLWRALWRREQGRCATAEALREALRR
jgi:hypothetical protein